MDIINNHFDNLSTIFHVDNKQHSLIVPHTHFSINKVKTILRDKYHNSTKITGDFTGFQTKHGFLITYPLIESYHETNPANTCISFCKTKEDIFTLLNNNATFNYFYYHLKEETLIQAQSNITKIDVSHDDTFSIFDVLKKITSLRDNSNHKKLDAYKHK